MAHANSREREVQLTVFDQRSQFVWVLLTALGLFVLVVGWFEWTF
jgi:hypothetical protein